MSTPTPSPRPQALNTPQLGKRTFLQELVGMATAFGLAGAGHAASPSATTQPPRRPGMEGKRFGMEGTTDAKPKKPKNQRKKNMKAAAAE